MMIDDAAKQFINATGAASGRANAILGEAEAARDTARHKAQGAYELACRTADDELQQTTARTTAQLRTKLAAATETFDAAAKSALHVADTIWIRDASPVKLELRVGAQPTPVALAIDEGGDRWVIDSEQGAYIPWRSGASTSAAVAHCYHPCHCPPFTWRDHHPPRRTQMANRTRGMAGRDSRDPVRALR